MINNFQQTIMKYLQGMTLKNRNCPICNSDKKEIVYHKKFIKEFSISDYYDVVICDECGFTYADINSDQLSNNIYYKDMSKYESIKSIKDGDRDKYIASFLSNMFKDKKIKILDIGCSTGKLLFEFKNLGYDNLIGIEPSKICCDIAQKNYGIDITNCSIDDFNTDEKFDLILLTGVLEHIFDLNKIINKIKTLLSNCGVLFIAVPDVENFTKNLKTPFQEFSSEHINYFTIHSIQNFLEINNFDIIDYNKKEFNITKNIEFNLLVLTSLNLKKESVKSPVLDYINKSLKLEQKIKKNLLHKLKNKEKIIVWGLGNQTQHFLNNGLDINKIEFFVDSNIHYAEKELYGKQICLPYEFNSELPILIMTYDYQDEIIEQIKSMNLKNEIITIYE